MQTDELTLLSTPPTKRTQLKSGFINNIYVATLKPFFKKTVGGRQCKKKYAIPIKLIMTKFFVICHQSPSYKDCSFQVI